MTKNSEAGLPDHAAFLDADRPGGQPQQKYVTLGCFCFIPDQRMRPLRPELVADLARSMAERGQIEPLVVTRNPGGGYDLIAGRHRLEAARKLKWPTIRVEVRKDMSADEMIACEIDENLVRGELSSAEYKIHILKAKELYERMYPGTKRAEVARRTLQINRQKAKHIGITRLIEPIARPTFADDMASKTGKPKSSILEAARIGASVPNIKSTVGTCLDRHDELKALAVLNKKDSPKVQDLIARAAAGEKVTAVEPSNAATEFAEWIAAKASPDEIPMVISWLQQVSAKGVTAALRRLQTERK